MSCALTIGYNLGCKAGIGGLSAAWLVEHSSLINIVEEGGVAQVVNVAGSWRKYNLQRGTSSFTESLSRDSNGLVTYTQSFEFVINSLSATMRNELQRLAKVPVLVVVRDRKGDYWLLGRDTGMTVKSNEAGSGKAASDRSGYSVALEGQEEEMALKVGTQAAAVIDSGLGICALGDYDGNAIGDAEGDIVVYSCDNGEFSGLDFDFNDFNV